MDYNPNAVAAIGGAAVTGIFSWLVIRVSKGWDARASAEAALMGTGPLIIAEQNKRIQSLEENYNTLWDRLHNRDARISELEVRNNDCEGRVNSLRMQVWFLQERLGIPLSDREDFGGKKE